MSRSVGIYEDTGSIVATLGDDEYISGAFHVLQVLTISDSVFEELERLTNEAMEK